MLIDVRLFHPNAEAAGVLGIADDGRAHLRRLTTGDDFDFVRHTVAWPQIEQLLNTLGYTVIRSVDG